MCPVCISRVFVCVTVNNHHDADVMSKDDGDSGVPICVGGKTVDINAGYMYAAQYDNETRTGECGDRGWVQVQVPLPAREGRQVGRQAGS